MASQSFNPKTWKGRLGTDLDLYTIGPKDLNGRQKIEPYTGGVTEVGDALSAGNLNNLEGRIDSAFESTEGLISSEATTRQSADEALDAEITKIKNGTTTVEKAKKDEDGNNIKSTYATKSALSEEISARQTADTNEQSARIAKDNDLQSQIVNVNSEVETLNAIVGGEAEVDHINPAEGQSIMAQSRLISYPNLLPNGKFGRVGARAIAWNQQLRPFSQSGWWNSYNCSTTVDGYNATLIISGVNGNYSTNFKKINGHEYLIVFGYKVSRVLSYTVRFGNQYHSFTPASANTLYRYVNKVLSNEDASSAIFATPFSGGSNNGDTISIYSPKIIDLTLMSMATGYTADELANMFSGDYPANFGTLIPLNPEGFLKRGVNLWDEEYEILYGTNLASKNLIPVTGGTRYYFRNPSIGTGTITLSFRDASGTEISYGSITGGNTYFDVPVGACYLRFAMSSSYGTTYNHDIQICLDSLPSAVKQEYHPYEGQTVLTPQIADGHYVNENCYDYVENIIEDGIVKGKRHVIVGEVDPSQQTWTYTDGTFRLQWADAAVATDDVALAGYDVCSYLVAAGNIPNMSIKMRDVTSGRFYIRNDNYNASSIDAFKASLGKIYYRKVTEEIVDCEPLRSFGISDYSTIEPITPQDELVNRIDVPFSVLTKSNNGIIQQITTNKENIDKHTSILSNHNKRLRNLEHKSGDYEEMIYPDEDYGMDNVPPGVEEYAVVSKLRGVSVAWNQQTKNGDFSDVSGGVVAYWAKGSNANMAISNNVATLTPVDSSISGNRFVTNVNNNVISGHKYLITITHKNETAFNVVLRKNYDAGNYVAVAVPVSASSFSSTGYILNPSFTGDSCSLQVVFDGITQVQVTDIFRYDLTQMFGSQVADYLYSIEQATTGAGVALFRALVKAQDNSYETGRLVSTTYESVGSEGFNTCDNSWENGLLNLNNGQPEDNASYSRLKNYCKCRPSTTYFFYDQISGVSQFFILWYDLNKQYLGYTQVQASSITSFDNAFYYKIRLNVSSVVGTLCFNVSQPNTSISPHNGEYLPYMHDTLTLPESVTLRGILKVQNNNLVVDGDEYEPKSGDVTRNYATKTLATNLGWNYEHNSSQEIGEYDVFWRTATDVLPNVKVFANEAESINGFITSLYPNVGRNNLFKKQPISTCIQTGTTYVFMVCLPASLNITTSTAFNEWLAQNPLTVTYKVASPTSESVTPIIDPTIQIEGGGNLSTTQTNDPAIVSAMDIGYMYQ